ncbi:thiol:disulfide interchange protein DsbA/DsbL [Marinobacter zhejiangensis]|uniref:Thiol:disulfide interchange protein n=1 Tax=Marinobacter zhejiangensis TaxID=488535 RepID=A0A1I4L414_9GAMM|nr:thiol:disulfide interchange protein DsbA/DsbL [Marinobacter zhejiangensis]SFL85788.1 thiol:disulfide interchange protein DsbA [Marinobacter zhejiangensis]
MTKLLKAAVCLMLVASFSVQAETAWVEGRHYERLENPIRTANADTVEVTEVFWYGCPHCYTLKPLVEAWETELPEGVSFTMLPAALGRTWEVHARTFYALQALGQLNQTTNDALFDAIAGEHRPLNAPEQIAAFLADYGVDSEEFLKAYGSFGVNAQFQQAQSKVRGARITGVPAMLVNGKFKVSASTAGGHEAMLEVVDYLIEQERAGR